MITMPTADQLVEGFIRHFWAADHAMRFTAAEHDVQLDLAPGVVLAGRLDAEGLDDAGAGWFADWKTANPRGRSGWREKWRFHPQSLTYGLLRRLSGQPGRCFTIRMAFKSDPPTYDHEWFEYSDGELDTWHSELLEIAGDMQRNLGTHLPGAGREHWRLNPTNCYRYGPSYPCPFVEACTHQRWNEPVAGLIDRTTIPGSRIYAPNTLVLHATAIEEYLECNEKYRRTYVRNEAEQPGEALTMGMRFHELLGVYYGKLIGEQNGRTT